MWLVHSDVSPQFFAHVVELVLKIWVLSRRIPTSWNVQFTVEIRILWHAGEHILKTNSTAEILDLCIKLNFNGRSERWPELKTQAQNLGLSLGQMYRGKIVEFRVTCKEVV